MTKESEVTALIAGKLYVNAVNLVVGANDPSDKDDINAKLMGISIQNCVDVAAEIVRAAKAATIFQNVQNNSLGGGQ